MQGVMRNSYVQLCAPVARVMRTVLGCQVVGPTWVDFSWYQKDQQQKKRTFQNIFFYRICEADPLTAFGLGIWTNLVLKKPSVLYPSLKHPLYTWVDDSLFSDFFGEFWRGILGVFGTI